MKAVSHIVWIIMGVILMLIVLAVIIAPTIRGQQTIGGTLSEADLIGCCSNWCAAGGDNPNTYLSTNCKVPKTVDSKGYMSMKDLCDKLGRTAYATQCKPPLCTCD